MAGSRSNDAGSSVQEGVPVAEPVRPLQQPEQSDMARAMAARRASQASGMANATHPDDLGAGNGSSAPDSSGVSGGAVADEDDDDSDDEKPLTQRMGKTKRDVEADSSDEEGAHVPPQPKKQKGGKGKAAADDGACYARAPSRPARLGDPPARLADSDAFLVLHTARLFDPACLTQGVRRRTVRSPPSRRSQRPWARLRKPSRGPSRRRRTARCQSRSWSRAISIFRLRCAPKRT